jgi:hypothetical protein
VRTACEHFKKALDNLEARLYNALQVWKPEAVLTQTSWTHDGAHWLGLLTGMSMALLKSPSISGS